MFASKAISQIRNVQSRVTNKVRGTVFEKWYKYWETVANDYMQVATGIGEDIKTKPLKSGATIAGLGFLAFCITKNPDQRSFRNKYIQCTNEVALVNPSLVKESTAKHLKYIESCYNAGILRYRSFGLFSMIWVDTSCQDCDNYVNKCSYLQWKYLDFGKQIIDIGFLNIWWRISREMLDYDVNYI